MRVGTTEYAGALCAQIIARFRRFASLTDLDLTLQIKTKLPVSCPRNRGDAVNPYGRVLTAGTIAVYHLRCFGRSLKCTQLRRVASMPLVDQRSRATGPCQWPPRQQLAASDEDSYPAYLLRWPVFQSPRLNSPDRGARDVPSPDRHLETELLPHRGVL